MTVHDENALDLDQWSRRLAQALQILDLQVDTQEILQLAQRASGAVSPGAGALTTFFEEASALISERLLRLYDQQATTATLDLWPRAALGMVRAAGERWLRQPDSEQKPSLESLAEELTNWLAYGIASTNAPKTR